MAYQLSSYNTFLSIVYFLYKANIVDMDDAKKMLLRYKKMENGMNLPEFVGELMDFKKDVFARRKEEV